MRTLLPSTLVPLALLGSTVLGAGVAVGLKSKPTVPIRPAIFQENAADQAQAQPAPAPAPAAGEQPAPDVAADDPVQVHRSHLASDGLFSGKISVVSGSGAIEPVKEMTVWFMQHGEVKSSAKVGVAGVFQAANLEPGVYSIIAFGPSGYLASGVTILPFEAPKAKAAETDAKPVSFAEGQAGLAMDVLAVPPAHLPKVLEVVNAYIPPAARTGAVAPAEANEYLTAAELANIEAALDSRTVDPTVPYFAILMDGNRASGLMTRPDPNNGKLMKYHPNRMKAFLLDGPTAIAEQGSAFGGTPCDLPLVQAQPFSRPNGVIQSQPAPTLNFGPPPLGGMSSGPGPRDRMPVAEATIATDGQFAFHGVSPGEFTEVIAGAEGFATFGVQLLPQGGKVTQSLSKSLVRTVSLAKMKSMSSGIDGTTIDMANFPAAYQQLVASQPAQTNAAPATGAPGGGGGSGGGGIGGGGDGLGLLGAALGAAGLAAALANNDDDQPNSP